MAFKGYLLSVDVFNAISGINTKNVSALIPSYTIGDSSITGYGYFSFSTGTNIQRATVTIGDYTVRVTKQSNGLNSGIFQLYILKNGTAICNVSETHSFSTNYTWVASIRAVDTANGKGISYCHYFKSGATQDVNDIVAVDTQSWSYPQIDTIAYLSKYPDLQELYDILDSANTIRYTTTNGTISGPDYGVAGTTITITVTPDTGYGLSSVSVYKTASQSAIEYTKVNDTTFTFVMPNNGVTVNAIFAKFYPISIAASPASGGSIANLPPTARMGSIVTFDVLVNENFTLASYDFTGADLTFDRDTMKGSFVMPERIVYGTFYFSSLVDENDKGGTSTPGGGEDATFDNESDTVVIPTQPDTGILYDVVGQGAGKGLITVYNPLLDEIQSLGQWLYSTSWGDALYQGIRDLFAKPIDALISLHILPFIPTRGANKHAITLGPHNTQINSYVVTEQYKDVSCGTLRIEPYWGSYLDYSPYTKISLYLPYIGSVELNPDIVMNKLVGIRYRCDVITGGCVAYLFTYEEVDGQTVESIFGEYSGSMALSIPMTGSDFSQLIAGFVSAVSSVAVMKGMTGGIAIKNAELAHRAANVELGAAHRQLTEARGMPATVNVPGHRGFVSNKEARNQAIASAEQRYQSAQEALQMARGQEKAVKSLERASRLLTVPYTVGQVMGSKVNTTISGTITGGLGLLGSQKPYVIITRPRQSLAEDYKHFVGYPCNMKCVLNTLSGYTVVEQVQLTNVPCTDEELAILYEGLKDGVYI